MRRRRNAGVRRKNIDKARRDDAQHTQAPFGFKLYVMRGRDFVATSEFRRIQHGQLYNLEIGGNASDYGFDHAEPTNFVD